MAVSALTAVEVPAAYAVPVALNIETSGGNPTQICAPDSDSPFNRALRDSLLRRVITCDMTRAPLRWKFPCSNQRNHQLFIEKLRLAKILQHAGDQRTVRGRLLQSHSIAKILLHDAFLAPR